MSDQIVDLVAGFFATDDLDLILEDIQPYSLMRFKETDSPSPYMNNEYIMEIKYDGWQTQLVKDGDIEVYTRNNDIITNKVQDIINDLDYIPDRTILIGELCMMIDGQFSISKLGSYLGSEEHKEPEGDLILFLFDIIMYNGVMINQQSLIKRKSLLHKLIKETDNIKLIDVYKPKNLKKVIPIIRRRKAEGVIFKHKDAAFKITQDKEPQSGDWVKYKKIVTEANKDDFVVYDLERMANDKIKMIFGQYSNGKLYHIGSIGGLRKELEEQIPDELPFVIELKYQERTEIGKLRHQRFSRFRFDKPPKSAQLKPEYAERLEPISESFDDYKNNYISIIKSALEAVQNNPARALPLIRKAKNELPQSRNYNRILERLAEAEKILLTRMFDEEQLNAVVGFLKSALQLASSEHFILETDEKRWETILIDSDYGEFSKEEIHSYYSTPKIQKQLFRYLKDNDALVIQTFSKDRSILKRHVGDTPGFIKIDKISKDITDPNNLNYWIANRTTEFHIVIGRNTNIIWVDIDPKEHDDFNYVKEITLDVYNIMNDMPNVNDIMIKFSGDRGFHVIGFLDEPMNVDTARRLLKSMMDDYAEDYESITTSIPKPGQIRLDTTTLKDTGSIRAPWSLNSKTGLVSLPIKLSKLKTFGKDDAKISKVVPDLKKYPHLKDIQEGLTKYKKLRDFDKTTEPEGEVGDKDKRIFVIQRHKAHKAGLHYDFRLSIDGEGWSWSVPKNLPKDKSKRLAIRTEDHPLEYFDFEGKIPKGSYGAGTVKIFDKGKYELLEKTENKLKIKLFGDKIDGVYYLTKMKDSDKKWLIFRAADQDVNESFDSRLDCLLRSII